MPTKPESRSSTEWWRDPIKHFLEQGPTAIAAAVVGAVVTVVLTALVTYKAATSLTAKPSPTVTATTVVTATVTATATVSATVTVTPSPGAAGGGNTSTSPNPGPSPASFSVPFKYFCKMQGAKVSADCNPGDIYVGPNLWSYAAFNYGGITPRWGDIITVPANSCSRLMLDFAVDSEQSQQGAIARIKVAEDGYTAATQQTAFGKVGRLPPVRLHGNAFGIEVSSSDGSQVYVKGSAICATEDGVR